MNQSSILPRLVSWYVQCIFPSENPSLLLSSPHPRCVGESAAQVMLGTDTEDPEIMKDLVAMMRGDTPCLWLKILRAMRGMGCSDLKYMYQLYSRHSLYGLFPY